MKTLQVAHKFKKDLQLMEKHGKQLSKITAVLDLLVHGKKLPPTLRDHSLKGNWVGRRECHIENDWLLIYKIDENTITFERTGSHSDLFHC